MACFKAFLFELLK